ncbi:TetR/AcrR family transcriptional regulator [Bacillus taeanensis]|uniref:TetR/AcrR family transcriptional regulator n=1 Tax=Bacillus taeanensis TaxID=273032 RepID=UPI0015EFF71E|nr:TetR/AcrR family transcriptional regulator [Bacillus taeanensis]
MGATELEIVRSATKLFKEHGYPATSIQDIAEDCQIAKGSVYKYFSSKEDLFNAVFDQCQNNFFQQIERMSIDSSCTNKERFLQQIIFRFQYFIEHKYIFIDLQEIPIEQNPKLMPLRLRVRAKFMNWYKECLVHVYGASIKPNIGDLVTIYKALLREYLFWILHDEKPVSIEDAAAFIIKQIDILAHHYLENEPKPLLTEAEVEKYMNWGMAGTNETKAQVTKHLIEKLAAMISELPAGKTRREEMNEALTLLKEETEKEQPKRTLLMALLTFLEKEEKLTSTVKQLKNVMML